MVNFTIKTFNYLSFDANDVEAPSEGDDDDEVNGNDDGDEEGECCHSYCSISSFRTLIAIESTHLVNLKVYFCHRRAFYKKPSCLSETMLLVCPFICVVTSRAQIEREARMYIRYFFSSERLDGF